MTGRALASVSTTLSGTVITALGLDRLGWVAPVLKLVPVVVSVGVGWLLFMFLYTVLPEDGEPWPHIRRGALIGAVGLAVLQYLHRVPVQPSGRQGRRCSARSSR